MSTPRIAISYGRFSFGRQKLGRSQERQLRRAERFAKKHRLTLDVSLSSFDEGLSGYWGDHAMKGHLAKFRALCGTPRVPQGAVLIIEDFDRLSRQCPDDAWELFREILLAGVEIAVLTLGKWFTKASLNSFEDRVLVQASQHRAHEESRLKADRGRDVWRARRKKARGGKFKPTRLPKWVRWARVEGRRVLEVIPERAATLLEMVRLHEQGEGCSAIAVALNARREEFCCWMARGHWENGDVHHLLTGAPLWGGYQPRKREDGGRRFVAVGEPIPDCYPAVITRERAAALAARLAGRRRAGGRRGVFHSVLRQVAFWAPSGAPLYVSCPGQKPSGRVPVYLERNDEGGKRLVADYYAMEALVLRVVQRWTPDALRPAAEADAGGAEARACETRLREIAEARQELAARLKTARPGTAAAIADALDALDEEEEGLKGKAAPPGAAPTAQALRECQALAVEMEQTPGEQRPAVRLRLNRRLRDLLEGVWVYRQDLGVRKAAVWVQVRPRVGEAVTVLALLGTPPAGWVAPDMSGLDFRADLRGR